MTFTRDLAWQTLDLEYRSSISFQFARYALGLKYELIAQEALHQAKRSVLDTLGCAIGAYEAPGRVMCEAAAKEIGGREEATVFCSGMRTSVFNATLINSFLVRFLDFNDIGGGGHNSDSISSILAISERAKASGKDFLTSVIVSYELGARVRESALCTFESKGWQGEARGGLSMPPALGRLMGLNEDQIANAIGLCASHSLPLGILDAHREECSMAKNLRFAFVCHDAILACTLAKQGITGPIRVVEGDAGIRQVLFQNEMDLDRMVDFSGWRIVKTKHKFLPANYVTQGHVALTLAIVKENNLKPEDIAAVRITAGLREKLHTSYAAKKYPKNAESADHSVHFTHAIAIKERALTPEQYSPEKFIDPVVLDLMEKVTLEVDPKLPPSSDTVKTEILTKDGRRFQKRADIPHGHFNDPLTDAEVEDKVRQMAAKYMPESQIKSIIDTVWNLESLDDVGKLAALMVFPQR